MDYQLGPGPLQVDQNTIDEKIKGDIGIVENGDVATHAITKDYYVIWKGDLYVAKTDISSGTTLSAASNGNLTAKPSGLGGEVAALNSNIESMARTAIISSNDSKVSHTLTFVDSETHFIIIACPNGNSFYAGIVHAANGNISSPKDIIIGSNFTYEYTGLTLTFTFKDGIARTMRVTDIILRGSHAVTIL